ncbi:DEAD/DEAH box helicase family protein [Paracoccaceae bacterium]|nr:DEAD/DEAH box helicase family protein [Paracoccaceae bacterium]
MKKKTRLQYKNFKMLSSLLLKDTYRDIAGDDLLNTFYIPCLKSSTNYLRAVGFFTAGSLMIAGRGLTAFLENEGKIKLIFNAEIDSDLFDAIKRGYEDRKEEILKDLGMNYLQEIEEAERHHIAKFRLDVLSLLIANGQLDIKIAITKKGMYHDKVGLFSDNDGNEVLFQGSANETEAALDVEGNKEGTSVWCSWKDYGVSNHMTQHKHTLLEMWSRDVFDDMVVLNFPDAPKSKLVERSKSLEKTKYTIQYEQALEVTKNIPKLPSSIGGNPYELKSHQRKALNAWAQKKYKGILKLATGAGKTITAIHAIVKIYQEQIFNKEDKKIAIVISVPYINLGDQWVEVLRLFNINAIKSYGGREQWESRLLNSITLFVSGEIDFFCVVVVNNTFRGSNFRNYFNMIDNSQLFFIGDECHHHGSEAFQHMIPKKARYLMGLSATPYPDPIPEKIEDEEVDADLHEEPNETAQNEPPLLSQIYVNGIVFKYPLQQAILDGVLTEYQYFPTLVYFSDEEADTYLYFTKKMAPYVSKLERKIKLTKREKEEFTKWSGLRARHMASAASKMQALESKLRKRKESKEMTLFYVGDGNVNTDTTEGELKQLTAVTRMLYDLKWRSRKFTYRETAGQREEILKDFQNKSIDALVAIRCLDEGIDIPACKEAHLLASTRNERQFVQRRGRVLRKDKSKQFAKIYDYVIALPPRFWIENKDAYLSLLEGEFRRIANFALISINASDSSLVLGALPDNPEVSQLFDDTFKTEKLKLDTELSDYQSQT